MATTRYKIAEQVLRIVNGGDPTEDSSIDIREVMVLVDQERDAIIKSQINDWMYTKSTATAKGELQINGAWLSQATVQVGDDDSRNGALCAALNFSYISLPNDMGIQKVEATETRFQKQGKVYLVQGNMKETTYNNSSIEFSLHTGPKVLDKKYSISFDFHITKTSMINDVVEQHQYAGVRTHKIQFNVDTSGYDSFENTFINFLRAFIDSPGFQKFLKDFNVDCGQPSLESANSTVEQDTLLTKRSTIRLNTRYGSRIDNFKINNVGDNGIDDGTDTEYGGANIGLNFETNNNIGLGWHVKNFGGNAEDENIQIASHENSHGVTFIINNTPYSSEFVNPKTALNPIDIVHLFVQENAYKIAKEQNIKCQKGMLNLSNQVIIQFEEITPKGGFDIDFITPGNAFDFIEQDNISPDADPGAKGYEPVIFTRMPSGGEHNTLFDKTVRKTGRQYYYIEHLATAQPQTGLSGGPAIYLYKTYNKDRFLSRYGNKLRITYIGTSHIIDDHANYPIPSDYEKIIIKNLVELLTVMKNASDDMANDNID